MSEQQMVYWSGDMSWPCVIEEVQRIDCSQLESLGVWVYAWLREHPHIALIAASDAIKRQLTAATLPVLWYNHCEEISQGDAGVTPSERDMLWS